MSAAWNEDCCYWCSYSIVCLSVMCLHPAKNGWTDRRPVWGGDWAQGTLYGVPWGKDSGGKFCTLCIELGRDSIRSSPNYFCDLFGLIIRDVPDILPIISGSSRISGHFSLSGYGSWQSRNRIILLTYYFVDYSLDSWLLCCTLHLNQDVTNSNMKYETPPTQLSGCPSQTSTVPKLLNATQTV